MNKIKISYNSPVILSFTAICFVATLLGIFSNGYITDIFFSVYRSSLINPMTYVRMFTHIFGHTDFNHFTGNILFILLLGPMIEEKYGSKNILIAISVTAFLTGLLHCILFVNCSLCGASGIVFLLIILSSFTAFKNNEIPLSFIIVAVIFIGKEIYSSIAVQDNISNITHILGGIIGGATGYFLNKT